MTVKELLNEIPHDLYEDYEFWSITSGSTIHTDRLKWVDVELEDYDKVKVKRYEIMDEYMYNNSVLANTEPSNFEKEFGRKDALVLVIFV